MSLAIFDFTFFNSSKIENEIGLLFKNSWMLKIEKNLWG